MREDLKSMNDNVNSFITQCQSNTNAISDMNNRISHLESRLSNPLPTTDHIYLKLELNLAMNRTFEIVIIGLSAKFLEDKIDTLSKIAKHLRITFEPWHISLTRIIKSRSSGNNLLLIRFISPTFRQAWLKAKKTMGAVKCCEILNGQPDNFIFINEHQTNKERH